MSGIVRLVLATVVAAIGVFFAFPGARAQAADRPPAMVDAAAEIARAEAEWRSKEASLGHEEIPAGAATYEKDGIEYTVIRDCAGFEAIEENLAGNYIVANDLDMTDFTTPIGWGPCIESEGKAYAAPESFTGIFDGNNYKFRNVTDFERMDLSKEPDQSYDADFYGVGLFNNNYGTIRNVIIDETCLIDVDKLLFSRLNIHVAFIAAQNCGTIENCFSHGKIIRKKNRRVNAAGICANLGNKNSEENLTAIVRNCVNYGDIILATEETDLRLSLATFACGIFVGTEKINIIGENLVNFGQIQATRAGGIANFLSYNEMETTVETLANYGIIRSIMFDSSLNCVGGVAIVGSVKNATNYGTVDCIFGVDGGTIKSGGIVGHGSAIGCVNYGSVSGRDQTGGIVGEGSATDCVNYGAVMGKNEVGGIAGTGYEDVDHPPISGCKQYGNVTGINFVGGIVGNSINALVQNNMNAGAVYGTGVAVEAIVGGNYRIKGVYYNKSEPQEIANVNSGVVVSEARKAAAKKRRNGIIIGCAVAGAALAVGVIVFALNRLSKRTKKPL